MFWMWNASRGCEDTSEPPWSVSGDAAMSVVWITASEQVRRAPVSMRTVSRYVRKGGSVVLETVGVE